ncbi:hypothetical protein KW786_01995 [Candidatus Parcubacteria bacterium]|nr:hypothetical protein [Candidatus Parcubacteria bacterium]
METIVVAARHDGKEDNLGGLLKVPSMAVGALRVDRHPEGLLVSNTQGNALILVSSLPNGAICITVRIGSCNAVLPEVGEPIIRVDSEPDPAY